MVKRMTRGEAELFHKEVVENAHKTEVAFIKVILARQEGIRTGWCHAELISPAECQAMIEELQLAYRHVDRKYDA